MTVVIVVLACALALACAMALNIVYAAGAKHGQEAAQEACEAVHVNIRTWALIEPGRKLYHVAERHLLGHPEFRNSDLHRAWLAYDEEHRRQHPSRE
jgi:hypothetical protein